MQRGKLRVWRMALVCVCVCVCVFFARVPIVACVAAAHAPSLGLRAVGWEAFRHSTIRPKGITF